MTDKYKKIVLSSIYVILSATLAFSAFAGNIKMTNIMYEGEVVRGPSAYYLLCKQSPDLCPASKGIGRPKIADMTRKNSIILAYINRKINREIVPVSDQKLYGIEDVWNVGQVSSGDCEDYVIAKRALLIKKGWPEETLLIAVAKKSDNSYHAVLVVRTNIGDLVLDNMTPAITLWHDTGYKWVIRQSHSNQKQWVRIVSDRVFAAN